MQSDDVGKALSSIEVTTGIGAAIGAALGGLLYDLGRFLLPMLVAACLPLCMIPFTARWLPDDSPSEGDEAGEGIPPADEDEASGKRRRGLACRRDLQRGMTCVSLFFSATVFEGLNPLFEPHLKRAVIGRIAAVLLEAQGQPPNDPSAIANLARPTDPLPSIDPRLASSDPT